MSDFKTKWKVFWRIVWECFKSSITPGIMYFLAGMVMLIVQSKNYALSAQIAWAVGCALVAFAYNGFVIWVKGGTHYEMLVSGNMKRRSAMQMGSELNISSYKFQQEYRSWKGFAIGAFVAFMTVLGSVIFGCNQDRIVALLVQEEGAKTSMGFAVVQLIFYCFAGWILVPLAAVNAAGTAVSFFVGCAFAIFPFAITGGMYIAGAYGRRNKRLREQEIAARAAEAEANKPKKINYGGLPGTKPRKRK